MIPCNNLLIHFCCCFLAWYQPEAIQPRLLSAERISTPAAEQKKSTWPVRQTFWDLLHVCKKLCQVFSTKMAAFETLTKLYQDVSTIYQKIHCTYADSCGFPVFFPPKKNRSSFSCSNSQDGPGKQLDFERKDAGRLKENQGLAAASRGLSAASRGLAAASLVSL